MCMQSSGHVRNQNLRINLAALNPKKFTVHSNDTGQAVLFVCFHCLEWFVRSYCLTHEVIVLQKVLRASAICAYS